MFRKYEDLPEVEIPNDREIKLSDGTLREGAQMPGVVIKSKDKLEIYKYLHKIGIEKVENFLYNDRDRQVTKKMLDLGYDKPEVTGWIRAAKKDVELLNDFERINETGVLVSVSDTHLFDKIGFEDYEEARQHYLDVIQEVVDHGLKPRCHIEDLTRSSLNEFAFPLIEEILSISPEAIIRVCDTLNFGIPFEGADPYSVPDIVEKLRDMGAKDIELHIHDDYGLGVANVLSGFWHGANWGNLTFMGLGERAGVAELEKILLFLEDRVGIEKYDLSYLKEFAEFFEESAEYHVPNNKAIVGKNVFAHESGIHTDGVLKNPMTYEPYPPEKVGAERKLMVGDSSGKEVIASKVNEILDKIEADIQVNKNDQRINKIYKQIQEIYEKGKRDSCILDEELVEMMDDYFNLEVDELWKKL
ncbi:MAG: Isopropylmalate/homocitrate/citramalate synthase LeuA family [Candidatus Methanohalarchaeum thermophilum]|uniref:Isopropylmalate/homocitrate/citramalate synthase LeuA family n=1 Tax=Methanohalarchaeum thermophilum TaxID=1903181 RepID=A0A1Q6DW77_METT1|nr:MAG: Isopropylmalate/homocitrate/citramalate synthase LeuA family [Candidatus Methanohalarchaeum thermophilum]